MTAGRGRALFDNVVRSCGISTVLAPGIVRRALLDQKVRPEDAVPADYEAALPRLSLRLAAYLAPDDVERQVRRIAALLAAAKTDADDDEAWSLAPAVEGRRATAYDRAALLRTGEHLREGTLPRLRSGNGDDD